MSKKRSKPMRPISGCACPRLVGERFIICDAQESKEDCQAQRARDGRDVVILDAEHYEHLRAIVAATNAMLEIVANDRPWRERCDLWDAVSTMVEKDYVRFLDSMFDGDRAAALAELEGKGKGDEDDKE